MLYAKTDTNQRNRQRKREKEKKERNNTQQNIAHQSIDK